MNSNMRTLLRLTCVCIVLTIQVAAHLRWPLDASWRRLLPTSITPLAAEPRADNHRSESPHIHSPRLILSSSSSSSLDKRQVASSTSVLDNAIVPAGPSIETTFIRLQQQLQDEIRAVFGGLLRPHSRGYNNPVAVAGNEAIIGRPSHASTERPTADGSRVGCAGSDDYDTEENTALLTSNSKRTMSPLAFVSDCDCREKVGFIELGGDHYPSILSGNWTCKQRCSNGQSGQCRPMLYNVHVLQRTSVPAQLKKGERQIMVPEELNSCWRFRRVTVVTDCLCVPGI